MSLHPTPTSIAQFAQAPAPPLRPGRESLEHEHAIARTVAAQLGDFQHMFDEAQRINQHTSNEHRRNLQLFRDRVRADPQYTPHTRSLALSISTPSMSRTLVSSCPRRSATRLMQPILEHIVAKASAFSQETILESNDEEAEAEAEAGAGAGATIPSDEFDNMLEPIGLADHVAESEAEAEIEAEAMAVSEDDDDNDDESGPDQAYAPSHHDSGSDGDGDGDSDGDAASRCGPQSQTPDQAADTQPQGKNKGKSKTHTKSKSKSKAAHEKRRVVAWANEYMLFQHYQVWSELATLRQNPEATVRDMAVIMDRAGNMDRVRDQVEAALWARLETGKAFPKKKTTFPA